MELYQLRYVLMLAEERSFSRAAERLFITQPTLSSQIKKLEAELGFALFQRSTKSVSVTARGEQFAERARRVVSELEQLQHWSEQARLMRSVKLVFGASALSMPHVSECIPDFLRRCPEVEFEYIEQWDPILIEQVRDGSIDIALASLPQYEDVRKGLYIFPIREEYVCVVTGGNHPLHDRDSVTLEELAGETIISTSGQSGLRALMQREFALRGLEPKFSMNLVSIEARISMVMKGPITFVMNEQFRHYKQENISVIPVEPKIFRTLALITAEGRKITPLEETFLHTVRDSLLNRLSLQA